MDIAEKHPTKYPLLAQLACRIYTFPTSSAASERSWSIRDFIHTKKRNRLDAARVEKLVFIFANAGDKDTKTSVLNNIRSGSESSDDADDDESKSEDESMAGSSDDFSPSSMNRQDDFNVFSYDGSEEQKEST
ncbi:hypothetical protein PI124_g543 [Phytophthora idaei]|nr:hypothetical protein PI125_g4267 [Phytophthora idaei]KAG3167285.1 hypothetical protein PI126_g3858 [Phytophthora idaei]KAG3254915.1 hypothetical protein PI124_g543 [Phytophthora idaei]